MKVGIIGAGTMGAGIAQVAAQNGNEVFVYDLSTESLDRADKKLKATMEKLVARGKFTDEIANGIIDNLNWVSSLESLKEADLVIEAIVENIDVKQKVFSELETLVSEDCILASNTSSLSLTSIAAACKKADRVVGIHFFNPAPIMKLVEIVPAMQTNPDIVNKVQETINSWGKITVVAKDTPGFIVNKVARPFYSESIKMLEENLASVECIDAVMTKVGGFRMGAFTLTDLIGHDVNYKVTETVWGAFYYDPRYKPSFTQKRLVEAKWLGKKSNKGFYSYPLDGVDFDLSAIDESIKDEIFNRVIYMLINEAADTLFLNIASKEDIDKAMKFGVNYPKGLFEWADELGIENCVNYLDGLYQKFGDDRYRCCPLLRKMAANGETFYK